MSNIDVHLLKLRTFYKLDAENLQDNFKLHKNNLDLSHFYISKVHYASIMKYRYRPSVLWYSITEKNIMIYHDIAPALLYDFLHTDH